MTLFHTHKWKVVSTDYTPGVKSMNGARFENMSEKTFTGLISGTTHIYQKCEECGEIKQIDVVGKYEGAK